MCFVNVSLTVPNYDMMIFFKIVDYILLLNMRFIYAIIILRCDKIE